MPRKSSHAPILRGVGRALAERLDEIVNLGLPKRLVKLLRSLESQERSSALSQATTPSRGGTSGTQQPTGNDPPPVRDHRRGSGPEERSDEGSTGSV
jgi:hypothetical protein